MTVYTTIPQDDSNLEITVIESDDLVTLDLNSASFNLIGAVNSINGLVGDVTLELGLPEAEVQTLINDSIAAIDYPVDSVNGQTGDVVLTTNEISEDVNLYYTDARVDDYLNSGNITSIAFQNTTLSWNADDGTLEFPLNAEVNLQIGQENVILARNESGATLPDGTAVRVTGAQGNRLTIDRADNANDTLSASTIAVTTQTIANNNPGYITTEGLVRGLNTSMWAEGAALYLGSNGAMTTVKPLTPLHLVPMGWVVRSHPTEGSIFVNVINGQELEELHDVLITNPTAGQGIVWDAVNGYWKNGDVTVDLTGYATEAYVDAAVFSGDYNDLVNQPSIPADVSDLTDAGGLLLTAEDLYKNEDITLHINNGTRAHWTYRTTYDAPNDIYNSDLIMQSFGVSTAGIFNLLRYKTAGDNIFLQYTVEDTGNGDDGSHRTIMELQGSETILGVNSDRLQINAPEIYSDNLTLASGGAFNFIGGPTVINSINSTLPDDYSVLEVNANNHIDLIAWDAVGAAQTNMLRVIKRNIEGGVGVDDSQWMAMQWGSSDGANFYQIGQLGSRYDTIDGHETKIQTFDPNTNTLINNWTVHQHYLYGGKPIWNINYNNTDRDALAVTQTGMLIWNTDAGALEVYDGGQWTGVGGGGGGASALGDLTDVTLTALSDGDLIRYNGIAGEWQNTNLGLTLTPTFSVSNGVNFTAFTTVNVTITNWGNYDDAHIFAEVYDSLGALVVSNANISVNASGVITFTGPAAGTNYELRVSAQDFGDLASDTATLVFNTETYGGTYRYWRWTEWSGGDGHTLVKEIELRTGPNQTGLNYPAKMTSDIAPAPYVASTDYFYPGYDAYKAFDDNINGSWWNLARPGGYPASWLQIDLGSSINIQSIRLDTAGFSAASVKLYASDTGAFTGEQVLIDTFTLAANSRHERG